ncbi:MAG: hypothetical protein ACPGQ5_05610 [Alphaproteobacteria bacterium]
MRDPGDRNARHPATDPVVLDDRAHARPRPGRDTPRHRDRDAVTRLRDGARRDLGARLHERKDRDMDLNRTHTHELPRRHREAPRSTLPRASRFMRFLAHRHDRWLAQRAHTRWREELHTLDPRLLRDIGLTDAIIDDVSRAAEARDMARITASETTFPPHCDPSLAKLAHDIEA